MRFPTRMECFANILIFSLVRDKLTRTRFSQFVFLPLVLGLVFLTVGPLGAQLRAKVTVDPSQPKATVFTTSFGVAADRWDAKGYDAETMKLLHEAGITNMRFPGNGGVDALYHWSKGTLTNPYTDDRAPAFPSEKMFPAMVPIIDELGSAVVSVNYGSNVDGRVVVNPLKRRHGWLMRMEIRRMRRQLAKIRRGMIGKLLASGRHCARVLR